jgi:hypothetical protein
LLCLKKLVNKSLREICGNKRRPQDAKKNHPNPPPPPLFSTFILFYLYFMVSWNYINKNNNQLFLSFLKEIVHNKSIKIGV